MSDPVKIVVSREGDARHLLDETGQLDDVYAAVGDVDQTWRNSHVESTSSLSDTAVVAAVCNMGQQELALTPGLRALLPQNKWWADMQPVGGTVLGPFDKHSQAIDAEVLWLREHNLPLPLADLPCPVPK